MEKSFPQHSDCQTENFLLSIFWPSTGRTKKYTQPDLIYEESLNLQSETNSKLILLSCQNVMETDNLGLSVICWA